jgi:SAM-dependent methyltransferase
VRWVVGERPLRVLDLGAGTGKLTRTLVELGHDVVAVEPSAEMLVELRRVLPGVESLAGNAEAIPLPDEAVDAVTAGQAFHWFEPAAALPEIARVLRPSGVLGLVWNRPDVSDELVIRLNRLLPSAEGDPDPLEALRDSELFHSVEETTFAFARELSRDDLVEGAGTSSVVAVLPDEERLATLAAIGALHDELAVEGLVTLPYVTFAYRTRRR